jgi:desampylase
MLMGRGQEVFEAFRARNLSDGLNRFLIDPRDHIDARRLARASGCDVVGFYHSHPRSGAHPSPTDLAEATYDALYLIVSLGTEPPEVHVYRLAGSRFERTAIQPVAD